MGRKPRFQWTIFCLMIILPFAATTLAKTGRGSRMSLAECLNNAYGNSEKLKTADLAVTEARWQVRQVAAGWWPTLNYQLYRAQNGQSDLEYHADHQGLSLTQNIYTGGKLSASIRQTRLKLDNALEDQRRTKQQLTYDVKQAYYQLWLALQKLTVAQASYDNMEKHFHVVEKKYQEGMVPRLDLLQAEVNWRKLKPDVIAAQNEVALDRSNLAILIGEPDGRTVAIETDSLIRMTPQPIGVTMETALETAYRDRPELRQINNNIHLAQAGVAIARSDYYPKLALSGEYKDDQNDLNPGWNETWYLTLDLSGTIFNGFATRAKVAAAQIGIQKQLSGAKQLKDEIWLKLEQIYQSLDESVEAVKVNQANRDLATESLRLTQIKLDEGLATNTDLLDAQLNVDEAMNGYFQGVCNYLIALANLDLLLGKD